LSNPTLHELTLGFFESFRDKAVFETTQMIDGQSNEISYLPVISSLPFNSPEFTAEFAAEFAAYILSIVNNAYFDLVGMDKKFIDDYNSGIDSELPIDIDYAQAHDDNSNNFYYLSIDNPVWVRDNLDEIINSYNVYLDNVPLSGLRKENGNFVFGPFNKNNLQMFIEHYRLSLVLYGKTDRFNINVKPVYGHENGNTVVSHYNVHLNPDTYETIIQASGLKPIADIMLKITQKMLPRGITELRM
jgi:hypothetical protein